MREIEDLMASFIDSCKERELTPDERLDIEQAFLAGMFAAAELIREHKTTALAIQDGIRRRFRAMKRGGYRRG